MASKTPKLKSEWRAPRLQNLGNLKDFVQTGHAYGKSTLTPDGEAMVGAESMPH